MRPAINPKTIHARIDIRLSLKLFAQEQEGPRQAGCHYTSGRGSMYPYKPVRIFLIPCTCRRARTFTWRLVDLRCFPHPFILCSRYRSDLDSARVSLSQLAAKHPSATARSLSSHEATVSTKFAKSIADFVERTKKWCAW